MSKKLKQIFNLILWFLEGIIVGFGAIMPGLSGGTLCVAFGMYLPLIGLLSSPKKNTSKYGKMLICFGLGAIVGFVGLSGLAAWLMDKSSSLVTCFFIGLIIGILPQLWKDAGAEGRTSKSYISLFGGFAVMLIFLMVLQANAHLKIEENMWGFLLCGLLWGLSFIVPGLSSSTLLLFFGLYQPMLDGISNFDFGVIIPLVIGIVICVMLLSKAVNAAYKKHYSIISHIIIGVVATTTVMIFPDWSAVDLGQIICIVCGALLSYAFTRICARLKK